MANRPALDRAPTSTKGAGGALVDWEQDLARRFARGESGALDEVVALYGERILRLAYRLLGWSEGAEDVAQEVFLAAMKQHGKFRGESGLGTWLSAIAIKKCRTHRRRAWLRWRWLARLVTMRERTEAPADARMEEDEASQRVRRAVTQLPAKDREVIVLYYLEELSVRQMADVLGISGGAIDVRLHRARRRLREKLADMAEE